MDRVRCGRSKNTHRNMNANLLLGNTLKTKAQRARDSVRALAASKINMDQGIRFGLSAATLKRDAENVKIHSEAVAYWTVQGLL